MAGRVRRPVIFPLSNPTDRAEATPHDLLEWTEGRAVIGTGSPFPPVRRDGHEFRIDQTNNAYVYPGIGLGAIAAKARRISDGMFLAAARTIADMSPAKRDPQANLLPPLVEARAALVSRGACGRQTGASRRACRRDVGRGAHRRDQGQDVGAGLRGLRAACEADRSSSDDTNCGNACLVGHTSQARAISREPIQRSRSKIRLANNKNFSRLRSRLEQIQTRTRQQF